MGTKKQSIDERKSNKENTAQQLALTEKANRIKQKI